MKTYHTIFPVDKDFAEKAFLSNDIDRICQTMVSIAFHERDWKWVQDKCLCFLMSKNQEISGLAATCLGHLARIHGQIEKDKVIPLLQSRLNDANIAWSIEDALNDIEMFVHD